MRDFTYLFVNLPSKLKFLCQCCNFEKKSRIQQDLEPDVNINEAEIFKNTHLPTAAEIKYNGIYP